MNTELRRACVTSLVSLASSPAYQDRADAGRSLANFADAPEAQQALVNLVLDSKDTGVIDATARALLQRLDATCIRLVATALATADPEQAEWIDRAVSEVLGITSGDRDAAVGMCEPLTHSANEEVRRGALHLLDELKSINPILRTVSRW
ncbi:MULTISPECIES: hypothetical protein [Amycolatopsis]|uniref:HEAT repeat domain-containing protein n=1 Tax=Amycolatopsis albidoflavus TaxID=102226 RepID=A0ABW5I5M3_9PSEU